MNNSDKGRAFRKLEIITKEQERLRDEREQVLKTIVMAHHENFLQEEQREKEKLLFTYSLFVYFKEYKVPEVGYSFIHERCTSLQDKVADRLMEKLDKIKYKIDYNKLEQSHFITRVNSGFTEEGIEDCLEKMLKDIPLTH